MNKGASTGIDLRGLSLVRYAAGEHVFTANENGEDAYFLVSGEIELTSVNASGQSVSIGAATAGTIFGEMGVLRGGRRSASATATTESICAVIDADMLKKRLAGLDPFVRFWIEFMSNRLIDLSTRARA